ncbi:MAG: glycosyl hydrolase family 28 protein [Bacteroidales bacterium]|nr:glycosyl hydrolase family 28 protein [Bacteroidales bacterium]
MKQFCIFLLLVMGVATAAAQDTHITGSRSNLVITDFGAVGDGVTLNTRRIQAAIDSASARYSRSGMRQTVVVPAGRFVSGTLYMKSGVELVLAQDAVLLGSTNPFDYVKDPYCRLMAFVFAVGQHDIAITGQGTIDGQGFELANRSVQLVHLGLLNDPLKYDRPNESNRPENVHFRECENILISGITLKDPANWCQHYELCRNLTIEGIKVDAKCYWNNDGLDVVDCQEVVVRNCDIDASDDAYCFKSHHTDGVSENILVENCVARSSANGIKFGTVTRGIFRNFRIKNMTVKDTYRSAITIASVDGSLIEDIEIDGLRSLHTGNPIFLRFSPRRTAEVAPALRNITIRNMYAEVPFDKPDAGYSYEGPVEDQPRNISPSSIVGTPGLRIQNILLENVELVYPGQADEVYAHCGSTPAALAKIAERPTQYPEFSMFKELPAWGLYLRHADNITLRNVTLRVKDKDYRPAIVSDDVNGLTLDHVTVLQSDAKQKTQLVANNTRGLKMSHTTLQKRQQQAKPATAEGDVAPQTFALDTLGLPTYRASRFGCKSNGTTDNTASIQHAIDYIGQQGGGTLVFEVGRYLTGGLRMKSGVNIKLNEGAILVESTNPYDLVGKRTKYSSRTYLFLSDTSHEKRPVHIYGLGRIEQHLPNCLTDNRRETCVEVAIANGELSLSGVMVSGQTLKGYASTVELYTTDSVYITSTLPDSIGRFAFHGLQPGDYYLKLFYDGALTTTAPDTIRLRESMTMLSLDTIYFFGDLFPLIDADYFTADYMPRIPIPNEYAATYARFAESIKKNMPLDYINHKALWDDIMPMMKTLPLLKIPKGEVVDAYLCGGMEGYITRPYLRRKNAQPKEIGWDTITHTTQSGRTVYSIAQDSTYRFTPNDRLVGIVMSDSAFPPHFLSGLEVPFTQQAIWQAYLLNHSSNIMPLHWHAYYTQGVCLFSTDALRLVWPEEGRCGSKRNHPEERQALLDSVTYITTRVDILSADTAEITATWWYDFEGVVEEHVRAIRTGKSVRFEAIDSKNRFSYELSIMF